MSNNRTAWAIALVLLATIIWIVFGLIPCQAEEPVARTTADYGWLKAETITVSPSGAVGAAAGTGTSSSFIRGRIYGLHVDYGATMTATTDITLTANSTPALTILVVADRITDTWYYPAAEYTNNAGTGLTAYRDLPLNDQVAVSVAQSSPAPTNTVVVTIYWGP
ncbi:MAG: hypothetical protein KKA73_04910 [Chloroflexi bacterium]|nr:hypothetical protein [Chloroflexota bacterium]